MPGKTIITGIVERRKKAAGHKVKDNRTSKISRTINSRVNARTIGYGIRKTDRRGMIIRETAAREGKNREDETV